jgi:hypothetical protein
VTSATFWPRTGCVLDASVSPETLTCQTGACFDTDNDGHQLLDCSIDNGGGSPSNPVSQFEVTSSTGAVNYDVSIAAGFNVEIAATPAGGGWVVSGTPASDVAACLEAGCTADLNATCPTNLRLQASVNGVTMTVGCYDPCTACANGADLSCDADTGDLYTDCAGGTGAVTNASLYCAKNTVVTPDTSQYAQASSNQGTATAFGQSDCAFAQTFVVPAFESGYALPPGQGICLFLDAPQTTDPHFNDYGWADGASQTTKNCGGSSPDYVALADGTPCGGYLTSQADGSTGYPNALGYTCQTLTAESTSLAIPPHLCMPPTTSGLGECTADSLDGLPLYAAVGGVANPSWLAAGLIAGGGTTPYYETFKEACPNAYAWQYDDLASGFACNPTLSTSDGGAFTGFDVVFCGSAHPAPHPGPAALVVGLITGGKAAKVGTTKGKVKVKGSFTVPGGMPLDRTTLTVHDLLDEVGGAGELGDAALLTAALLPQPGSTAVKAVYASASSDPAVRKKKGRGPALTVKVKIRNVATGEARYSLAMTRGRLGSPQRCSGERKSTTLLETGLGFRVDDQREIVAGGVHSWKCAGKALRRAR